MSKANTVSTYQDADLQERVVSMARVAKVVKGGRRFSFNALTVVGDANSQVGVGFGKAKEVPEAIRKSIEDSKKNMLKVKKQNTTIPHRVIGRFKSATVLLKPCAPGTGIIAGEAIRAVVELGGIQDVLTKRYGSSNKLNIVKATINALEQLSTFEEARKRRGLSLPELFGEESMRRRGEKEEQAKSLTESESDSIPSQDISETSPTADGSARSDAKAHPSKKKDIQASEKAASGGKEATPGKKKDVQGDAKAHSSKKKDIQASEAMQRLTPAKRKMPRAMQRLTPAKRKMLPLKKEMLLIKVYHEEQGEGYSN